MAGLLKSYAGIQIGYKFLQPSFEAIAIPLRGNKHLNAHPRKRQPVWLPQQSRVKHNENVTAENAQFVREVIESQYGRTDLGVAATTAHTSPLKEQPIEPSIVWSPKFRRTGVIAKKIGEYPMWLKDGSKVHTTLLQVLDNHVIKYIPPEEYAPIKRKRSEQNLPNRREKWGCLVVGAEGRDPQKFTKAYCGLFKDSGVMPKRVLTRFRVSPEAALQPGTPLYAAHYRPGEIVDIRGITVDRGFQGVCKRWGFKGGPASHGTTKTHRRPGNIGGGGEKGRVWPGTKMPGHMGNRARTHRGIKILRVNTKYNLIWTLGHSIPGTVGSSCYIYDTLLPLKRHKTAPHFPTYLPTIVEEPIAEELFSDDLHPFTKPTITFSEEST